MILGGPGPLADAVAAELRALGAELAPEGPADVLIHVAPAAPPRAARPVEAEIVEPLRRAAQDAPRLAWICLVRPPAEAGRGLDTASQVVEDGLRYLAARYGIPLAQVRAGEIGSGRAAS